MVVGGFGGEGVPAAEVGRGGSVGELQHAQSSEVYWKVCLEVLLWGQRGLEEVFDGHGGVVVPSLCDVDW